MTRIIVHDPCPSCGEHVMVTQATYIHPDGGEYILVERGEMKHPQTGAWLQSVAYRDIRTGKLYFTTRLRWEMRFKLKDA